MAGTKTTPPDNPRHKWSVHQQAQKKEDEMNAETCEITSHPEVPEEADATEQNKCALIINAVASHYDVTKDQILSFDRSLSAATARQVAMYIMRTQKREPISSVAEVFKRNSTTVIYAVVKIRKRLESEPDFRKEMEEITSMID